MGSIVKLSPQRCVRRKAPRVWSPEMARFLPSLYAVPAFEADDPDQAQLESDLGQRRALQRAMAKLG